MWSAEIDFLISSLKDKKSLFVLTGAGISADSNIPTFRGKNGLWKNYRATDLATPEAFTRDPELVWEWYHWRQSIIHKTDPNKGHITLAEFARMLPSYLLLTQNVDNLHQRAGSEKILEIHGNIFRARCTACNLSVDHSLEPKLPKCSCGALLRPDVVWFGEPVPTDVLNSSLSFIDKCDMIMTIGTSALVQPAASLPVYGKNLGKKLIEINPDPTPISSLCDFVMRDRAAEVLPKILGVLNE